MTKEEVRGLLQQTIDDPRGLRWKPERLDLLVQVVMDPLWTEILRIAPDLLSVTDTITPLTTPGYIDLAEGGGDLTERLFRIQEVVRNGREYGPTAYRDVVLEDDAVVLAPSYTYLRKGSRLYLFPFELTPEVELTYAYRPTRFTALEDEDPVVWPDGHDGAYIWKAAAAAVGKGVAEDPTTFDQWAREALFSMLSELERYYAGPITVEPSDPASVYGSVD
jgi:hypothetical protein